MLRIAGRLPLWLLGLVLAAAVRPAPGAAEEPFVFVSLPDTQVYSENRFPDLVRTPAVTDPRGTGAIFFDQTRWLVENAESRRIRYVGHLGDIVQDGSNIVEWELAKAAMQPLLDADIPHGTVMGNHDDTHPPDYARNYLDYFGPQVFAGREWYTASSPGGGANLQILEHARYRIGFLNFSIDHPRSEVEWAHRMVEDHPDTIFVIGTHRYLYDLKLAGGRYGEEVDTILGTFNVEDNVVDGVIEPVIAEDLFHEFVTRHPNILMIHAGHFHAEWLRLDGLNLQQKLIIQILTDYQSTRNGGDGWLRLYELDFEAGEFRFDTYSPTLDRQRTILDHFVETIFLAWDQREQLMEVLDVSEQQYLLLLDLGFKQSGSIPDGFLLQHPAFDEPEERAYYERYLDELFLGNPPPGFGDILEWENLWAIAFAADPDDVFDFSPSSRSPQGLVEIDFLDYFTPSAAQLSGWAFDDLLATLGELSRRDYRSRLGRQALDFVVRLASWFSEAGRHDLALGLLEDFVLPRTDGCALRGRADRGRFWWIWWRRGKHLPDLVKRCEAQAALYPQVTETIEVLESLGDGES